jgi:hypothetical protein
MWLRMVIETSNGTCSGAMPSSIAAAPAWLPRRKLSLNEPEPALDAVEPVAEAIDAKGYAGIIRFENGDTAADLAQIGLYLGNVITDYPQPVLHSHQEMSDPLQVNILR